jgi:hypothetical protein
MDALVDNWDARESAAIARVKNLLMSRGKTLDSVIAMALEEKLDTVQRPDHLITIATGRRNAALREIDRRRVLFGEKLRSKIHDVESVETLKPPALLPSEATRPLQYEVSGNCAVAVG